MGQHRLYPAFVHKNENSSYGVSFPDFAGCVSAGDTLEELQFKAEEALAFYLSVMIEDNDFISEPMPLLAAWEAAKKEEALAVILVKLRMRRPAVRFNMTMSEGLLVAIDQECSEIGISRSAFLALAAKRMLHGA